MLTYNGGQTAAAACAPAARACARLKPSVVLLEMDWRASGLAGEMEWLGVGRALSETQRTRKKVPRGVVKLPKMGLWDYDVGSDADEACLALHASCVDVARRN